jgi:hypothetical protein
MKKSVNERVTETEILNEQFPDIQGEHEVFSDYKHILQENYVEYKHNFLM